MAINKKLIHFKSKEKFNTELANGNILDTSIVFIKETKEIWTHGQLYDCAGADTTELLQTINDLSEEVRENELVAATAISDLYTKINGSGTSGTNGTPMVNHGTSDTEFTLTPNTLHVWDTVESLNLTLSEPTEGIVNEYHFIFKSGANTVLSLPSSVKWSGGVPIVINPYMVYSVSILNNLVLFSEFPFLTDNPITLSYYYGEITIESRYPIDTSLYIIFENGDRIFLDQGSYDWTVEVDMLPGTYGIYLSFTETSEEEVTILADDGYRYIIPETFVIPV